MKRLKNSISPNHCCSQLYCEKPQDLKCPLAFDLRRSDYQQIVTAFCHSCYLDFLSQAGRREGMVRLLLSLSAPLRMGLISILLCMNKIPWLVTLPGNDFQTMLFYYAPDITGLNL
jgi:hypothetical protein